MWKYFIIGADAAGLSAAVQIKRRDAQASIKVINKGKIISYGACGIPYVLSGDIKSDEELIHFTPSTFKEQRGITVEINKEVTDIFPEEHTVQVENLETGETYTEKYQRLLIASGAVPKKLPFIDYSMDGIFSLHNIEDLRQILGYLENQKPKRAAVIGAGNIGLELVEALQRQKMEIFLLEALEIPVANWPPIVQRAVVNKLQEKEIHFIKKATIKTIEKKGNSFLITTNEQEFETGIIFSVVGIRPATGFCGDKLHKMENGALIVDRHGRTSNPDIFAAGDCTSVYHKILEKNVYFPLGSIANKMGRIAGLNMAEETIAFPGIVGTQIFKFFELSLAQTGLSLEEAEKHGVNVETFSAQRLDKAGYYPGAGKVTVEIVMDKDTGILIGASTICESNAAQFIDPAALAVSTGAKVRDLAWLDAAYAPPYAPVWNALISAVLKAANI